MSIPVRGYDLSVMDSRPKPRLGVALPIACTTFAFLFVLFALIGFAIGGSYLGSNQRVDGSIIQVDNGRPTVAYTVDGQSYQVVSADHGSQFSVGGQVQVCYAASDPSRAGTCTDRAIAWSMVGVAAAALLVAVVLAVVMVVRRLRAARVINSGQVVSAVITGTRSDAKAHLSSPKGTKILWYVQCAWTDPMTGHPYEFETASMWAATDPLPKLAAAGVTELPVYIDPADIAKNYVVDDRPVARAL